MPGSQLYSKRKELEAKHSKSSQSDRQVCTDCWQHMISALTNCCNFRLLKQKPQQSIRHHQLCEFVRSLLSWCKTEQKKKRRAELFKVFALNLFTIHICQSFITQYGKYGQNAEKTRWSSVLANVWIFELFTKLYIYFISSEDQDQRNLDASYVLAMTAPYEISINGHR